MKPLLLILFLLLTPALSHSQERDYIAEMFAAHHGIAQKEGTDELLKELLGPYAQNKEVFAILFAPQACPRCEVDITYVLKNIQAIKPEAEFVVIAAYPDAELAKQYVKEKFKADRMIIDTENKHEKIFHYRTGRLAVTYILQIDAQQGRLMCGGDSPNMSTDFLRQFCYNTTYMPYAELNGMETGMPIARAPRHAAGTYRSISLHTGKDLNISTVTELPDWQGNSFLYPDELLSAVLLFDIDEDTARLSKRLVPTEAQKKAFVRIPDKDYKEMEAQGQVFIMANCCAFVPSGNQAIASFSLPDLSMENDTTIAYYNKAALLYTEENADTCRMAAFDFEHDSLPLYMYTHASRIMPIDKNRVMFGCRKGFPISCTAEDCRKDKTQDIFLPGFYEDTPFLAVFDRTSGKRVKRFGRLPEVFKKSMTGYYFTIPIADIYQDRMAYSDGCSGKLWLRNMKTENEEREFDLFRVDIPDSILKKTAPLRYTDDYFDLFFTVFHQYVEMVKLDEKGIHCLIRNGKSAVKDENDTYEYRLLSYTGERQNSFQIKFEEGDEVLAVSLGKDGQGKVFPYYMCRNGERCYLKLPGE